MRAIIEIFLAIIFSVVVVGTSGARMFSDSIKKEALIKVSNGLGSLEVFTKELTRK